MHEVLRATSGSRLFAATAAPYLLLDKDLHIQGANPAHLRATGRSHDDLLGSFMFDAFPDNPEDATADGVRNLGASLEHTLRHGVPDDLGVQRYDIPDLNDPGTFRHKTWTAVNIPLLDADGRAIGVLNHVEDVTAVHDLLTEVHGADSVRSADLSGALLRRVMLAAARYGRTAAGPDAVRAAGGLSRTDSALREALWHRIVRAAREAHPKSCSEAVCSAAVEELPTIGAAAISLHCADRMPLHLAVTSRTALRAEEAQWTAGEGPSLTAYNTGRPVLVPDLERSGERWPFFADSLPRIGVSAAFAFPLRSATAPLGTLTLYRTTRRGSPTAGPPAPDPHSADSQPSELSALAETFARAETFAEIASAVLFADMDSGIVEEVRATADADDVNLAIGVLAAVRTLRSADAAALLRSLAAKRRLPLADTARELLTRHLPGPGTGTRP